MDITEIRYLNFLDLFEQFKEATREDYPGAPDKGMLKLFGVRLGISEGYMSHIQTKYKGIGRTNAKKIEKALNLPHGWMDQQHQPPKAKHEDQPEAKKPSDDLQLLFEYCRRKDAAKTHSALVSLLDKLP